MHEYCFALYHVAMYRENEIESYEYDYKLCRHELNDSGKWEYQFNFSVESLSLLREKPLCDSC